MSNSQKVVLLLVKAINVKYRKTDFFLLMMYGETKWQICKIKKTIKTMYGKCKKLF